MAKGVGTPLQLDKVTKLRKFGHYARVLVDVDLSKLLLSTLWVEVKGMVSMWNHIREIVVVLFKVRVYKSCFGKL